MVDVKDEKPNNVIVWVVLLAMLGVVSIFRLSSDEFPAAATFKPVTTQAFTGLIAWLFAVALFVERAVEVVVMVFRDRDADILAAAEESASRDCDEAVKKAAAANADVDATTAATDERKALDAAHKKSVSHRAETKQIALLVGFVLGTLVSLAGVRALHGLLDDKAAPGSLFDVADIVVTGAMLAGGSEGIHRMANVFTSFMDSLSTRADQIQKQAKQDAGAKP